VIDWMGRHIDLVGVAVVALAGAMLYFKAASIGAAIASGAAWALANLPIILMAVLIGAVILIVEDLYQALTGGKSVLKDLYNAAIEYLGWGDIAGGIKAAFTAVFDFLTAKVNWLIEKGEWLGAKLHDLANGSDEFNSKFQKGILKQYGLENVPGMSEGLFGDSDRTGIDSFAQAPVAGLPANTENNSGGNSFQAKIEINGAGGSPDQTAKAVTSALSEFWHSQMKKAASQTGVAK
jgi:hypothetical protein